MTKFCYSFAIIQKDNVIIAVSFIGEQRRFCGSCKRQNYLALQQQLISCCKVLFVAYMFEKSFFEVMQKKFKIFLLRLITRFICFNPIWNILRVFSFIYYIFQSWVRNIFWTGVSEFL